MKSTRREKHLGLWDGDCGFCRRAAQWMQQHDRHQSIEFVPYQNAPSPPMTPQLAQQCAEAFHVVTRDNRILRGARAVLFVLERTEWKIPARILARSPLIWPLEIGYRLVARHRGFFSRFFFRHEK